MVSVTLQVFERTGAPFASQQREFDGAADLGDGEVLVRIDLATICGSDLHTIDGTRQEKTPCVLGHEAVGTVVASRGRAGPSVGDRVTWTIADSCGQCAPCVDHDLPQKCERLFKYGHSALTNGSGLNGCYASHVVLRAGTHIVPLPDGGQKWQRENGETHFSRRATKSPDAKSMFLQFQPAKDRYNAVPTDTGPSGLVVERGLPGYAA